MTIDQALAAEDPIYEIAVRLLQKSDARMSPAEKVWWAVQYFTDDTLNGGLEQTMADSTGEFLDVVEEFARRYGPAELREIVTGIRAALDAGPDANAEALDALTERFHAIEDAIHASLIEMARRNREAFDLLPPDPARR